MLRTQIYLDPRRKNRLGILSAATGKPAKRLIREADDHFVAAVRPRKADFGQRGALEDRRFARLWARLRKQWDLE